MPLVRYTEKSGAAGQVASVTQTVADNLIKAGLVETVNLDGRGKKKRSPHNRKVRAPVVKDGDDGADNAQ